MARAIEVVTVGAQGPQGPPGSGGGVSDHGALTGLLDNDHPQYLLASDYDAELNVIYAVRIDAAPSGANEVFYKGEAAVGALESAAAWRIRKIVVEDDDDSQTTWANGSAAFDKTWNDRLTYTYS